MCPGKKIEYAETDWNGHDGDPKNADEHGNVVEAAREPLAGMRGLRVVRRRRAFGENLVNDGRQDGPEQKKKTDRDERENHRQARRDADEQQTIEVPRQRLAFGYGLGGLGFAEDHGGVARGISGSRAWR
jgi:hypothetical protein